MGIYASDLRDLVIRPTLHQLNEWSVAAENLLLGTAAVESRLCLTDGGLFGITSQNHIDVWDEYLITKPDLASHIRGLASQHQFLKYPHHELITNLVYATGVAWMIYKQHGIILPEPSDLSQLAKCWLDHYTHRNQGSEILIEVTDQGDLLKYRESQLHSFITSYRVLILCDNQTMAA